MIKKKTNYRKILLENYADAIEGFKGNMITDFCTFLMTIRKSKIEIQDRTVPNFHLNITPQSYKWLTVDLLIISLLLYKNQKIHF